MASLGLGQIEEFPFLTPPDSRGIRDGLDLLRELGALDDGAAGDGPQLTRIGRQLARLPIEPRFARMVLESKAQGVSREVLAIVAGLTIQDPRERPLERREQADGFHARFVDPTGDFLTLLNLWNHLEEQQRELSGSAFRRMCKAEFLNYLRVREWQDLVPPARAAREAARPARRRTRRRAQRRRHPSGAPRRPALADRAARRREDLERSRRGGLRARDGAPRPPAAGRVRRRAQHALRGVPGLGAREEAAGRAHERRARRDEPALRPDERAPSIPPGRSSWPDRSPSARFSEPRWERRQGSAVADEKVTLFGVPIVAKRRIQLGRVDPALARELFIRHALVEEDWDTSGLDRRLFGFVRANRALRRELGEVEERTRRRDILAGDEAVVRVLRGAGSGGCRGHASVRALVARRAPPSPRPAHDDPRRPARRRGGRRSRRRVPRPLAAGRPDVLARATGSSRAPTTTA